MNFFAILVLFGYSFKMIVTAKFLIFIQFHFLKLWKLITFINNEFQFKKTLTP